MFIGCGTVEARVQAEIAESYGVSQPRISRAITTMTPLIEAALRTWVPTAEDLDTTRGQCLVDGTLVACWSWKRHPDLGRAERWSIRLPKAMSHARARGCSDLGPQVAAPASVGDDARVCW